MPALRAMLPIPIAAGQEVADRFGYDQVVIIGRRVGNEPDPCGEHVTTYGVDPTHCRVAAAAGRSLQRFMQWPLSPVTDPVVEALNAAILALRSYQYGNAATDLAAGIADAGDAALVAVGLAPATPPTARSASIPTAGSGGRPSPTPAPIPTPAEAPAGGV